jgi:hypothetical protein
VLIEWEFAFINSYSVPPTPPPPPKANSSAKAQVRYRLQQRDYEVHLKMKQVASPPVASKDFSFLRTWLGDEPVDLILVFNQSDHDLARSRFPEAYVYLMPPRKGSNPMP